MRRSAMVAAICLLGACSKDPESVGNAITESDMSSVNVTGMVPDKEVLQTRRIVGRWQITDETGITEMNIGGDGSFGLQTMSRGAVTDMASGRWKWVDGRLTGTSEGATGQLRRYSRWSAAFVSDVRMNVSGTDGAIMVVSRKR